MEADLSERLSASMPWLDGASKTLTTFFRPLLGQKAPRGPRDLLYGVWLGHPLHPPLVTIPIGFWCAASLFDLLREERAADVMIDAGTATALAAMLTGAAQYQDAENDEEPRRIGALHAYMMIGATALYAGSAVMRRNGNRAGGVALSAAGLAVMSSAAWLGGALSFEMGIGVDHNAFEMPTEEWTDVLPASDLVADKPKRVMLGDAPVMLLRQGDKIHSIGALCGHMGGPLEEGAIADGCVTCPWHGSVFRLDDGAVLHGPATFAQPLFEARERNGQIALRSAPAQPLRVDLPAAEQAMGEAASQAQALADRVLHVLPGQEEHP